MMRVIILAIGLVLMGLSLLWRLFPNAPAPNPERFDRAWLFDCGLLLAIGAHGWPEGVR